MSLTFEIGKIESSAALPVERFEFRTFSFFSKNVFSDIGFDLVSPTCRSSKRSVLIKNR